MATFDRNDTAARLIEIIAQKLHRDKSMIKEDQNFQDLGADSLDMVEIVMRVEEVFGIEINDEDTEKFVTVKDVVDYIQNRRTK